METGGITVRIFVCFAAQKPWSASNPGSEAKFFILPAALEMILDRLSCIIAASGQTWNDWVCMDS
jgi:hypothetical protein